MKIMLELPAPLLHAVKMTAEGCGQTLTEFVVDALRDRLTTGSRHADAGDPPWMRGFGSLRSLGKEAVHIQTLIDNEFRIIEPEDRA